MRLPPFPLVTGWTTGFRLLEDELRQLREEGRSVQCLDAMAAEIENLDPRDEVGIAQWWQRLAQVPSDEAFPFVEPSDLVGIRAGRPDGPRRLSANDEPPFERFYGAWLGRAAGCALGKPVECFVGANDSLTNRQRIRRYLMGIDPDEYPIRGYIPAESLASAETGRANRPLSTRESITFMESDDDIRYTVLGQIVLARKGADFSTEDVARAWMEFLGYGQVCTAETQAYRNLILAYPRNLDWDVRVDWTWVATHHNPYREWIGAQIRADPWGYAAPGNPELAAEFAWRDARMTHVKNGIYGAMFSAAMIAAAFTAPDPLTAVEAGLAQIPQRSRLWRDLRATIEICREYGCRASEFEAVHDRIEALLGHYQWVHTNNNAALVVAAILLGQDDFEKTIGIALMGGWDTDCNGATAGSVWGAMHGAASLPPKWTDPLHDTLYSLIPDYHPVAISECARRSAAIARKVRAAVSL